MKRIIILFIAIVVLLSGCTTVQEQQPDTKENTVTETAQISAVWIYYDELSMVDENGGTEQLFRDKIETMLENCVSWGINTVFLQVRPCADSFYKSDIFPWTYYLTGEQGKAVSYDPLEICISIAHKKGLKIHAWINPFRIAFNDDVSLLADNHPAHKWIENKSGDVVFANEGIYFSPASPQAQRLVLDGVREIVRNYDVDGIHIDDYFYPSTDESVDEVFYKKYVSDGGKLPLDEWRLDTVSAFVSQMHNTVKGEKEECIFSISPAGNIQNNYDEQFADVELWCSSEGYADWIIPQLYYGFENDFLPFDEAVEDWQSIHKCTEVKMIYGLAAYKVNESDEEWDAGKGIIDRQLQILSESPDCYGAAYFSYSSLADEKRRAEFTDLSTLLS